MPTKANQTLSEDERLTHPWGRRASRSPRPPDQTMWGWGSKTFFRRPTRGRQWSRGDCRGSYRNRRWTSSGMRGHKPLTQLWAENNMILTVKRNKAIDFWEGKDSFAHLGLVLESPVGQWVELPTPSEKTKTLTQHIWANIFICRLKNKVRTSFFLESGSNRSRISLAFL